MRRQTIRRRFFWFLLVSQQGKCSGQSPKSNGKELRKQLPPVNAASPIKGSPSLSYARALRAIGESLETKGISCFDLEKSAENYIVRPTDRASATGAEAKFIKKVAEIVRRFQKSQKAQPNPTTAQQLCYTPLDVSRLTSEQRARHGKVNAMPDAHKLSQILRLVGDDLDRKEARAFTLSVSHASVSVWYANNDGHRKHESFTIQNLYDRAVRMYLRRTMLHRSMD